MSLVNDMLRDLDKRRQLPIRAQNITRVINTYDESDGGKLRPGIVAMLVLVCLVAGMGGGYVIFSTKGESGIVQATNSALPELESSPLIPVASTEETEGAKIQISEDAIMSSGFSLGISASEEVDYSILEKHANGMTLQLENVASYTRSSQRIEGVSVIQTPQYTQLEIELDKDADFEVFKAANGKDFELVLTASYRGRPRSGEVSTAPGQEVDANSGIAEPMPVQMAMVDEQIKVPEQEPVQETLQAVLEESLLTATISAPVRSDLIPEASKAMPVRVNRGLTFEETDRNTSLEAVSLVDSGRLQEAYEKLVPFIDRNPEAHYSRETLATILLAQNEVAYAGIVVDDGMKVAPNYAPYKKIKARLLMNESKAIEALELMKRVPPMLSADPEYHEILASLYQQTGQHAMAVSTYQELLRMNRDQGRWWAGMAISHDAQGEKDKAVASFQAALQTTNLDARLRRHSQDRISVLSN